MVLLLQSLSLILFPRTSDDDEDESLDAKQKRRKLQSATNAKGGHKKKTIRTRAFLLNCIPH
jgi:phage-related minor tail protein